MSLPLITFCYHPSERFHKCYHWSHRTRCTGSGTGTIVHANSCRMPTLFKRTSIFSEYFIEELKSFVHVFKSYITVDNNVDTVQVAGGLTTHFMQEQIEQKFRNYKWDCMFVHVIIINFSSYTCSTVAGKTHDHGSWQLQSFQCSKIPHRNSPWLVDAS